MKCIRCNTAEKPSDKPLCQDCMKAVGLELCPSCKIVQFWDEVCDICTDPNQ
jgi:ribosomal protein L36